MSTANHAINEDQRAAVAAFRDANGRGWKEELGLLWMNGNYSRRGIDQDQAALLQQVRNQFGPEWLANVTRADLCQEDGNTQQNLEAKPQHAELVEASVYYRNGAPGWVALVNGNPWHFWGKNGKQDAEGAVDRVNASHASEVPTQSAQERQRG